MIDRNETIIFASPSLETMLGHSPSNLVGKKASQIIHSEDRSTLLWAIQALFEDAVETVFEIRFLDAEGSEWVMEAAGSKMKSERSELNHMLLVSRDIRERKRLERQLKEMAFFDLLTGLPNRRYFEDAFSRRLVQAARMKQKLALLYLDLDGFKNINDTQGHATGDKILIQFSSMIEDVLCHTDLFARVGGDEFVILLADSTEEKAVLVSKKIIHAVQNLDAVREGLVMGISIGISMYPKDGTSKDKLLQSADEAMYRAKQTRRNQYAFYS